MTKTYLTRLVRGKLVLAAAISCLFAPSALAQNAGSVTQIAPGSPASANPAQRIGPAPANSKQHQILKSALSPQTRQTLEEAMNSADAAHPAPPAK